MAGFLSILVAIPVLSAVQALFQALLVQLATRIVAGFTPTYRIAYKAVFWGLLATGGGLAFLSLFLAPLLGGVMRSSNLFDSSFGLILLIGALLIHAAIYVENIEDYERGPINFKQASLIILVSILILIVLIAIGLVLMGSAGFLIARFS